MRQIARHLSDHLREDFRLVVYLYTAVFLTVTITINYTYDFERSVLNSCLGRPSCFVYYACFYAFAYYGVAVPQLLLVKRAAVLKDPAYWSRTGSFILVLGFSACFHWYLQITPDGLTQSEQYLVKRVLIEISPFLTIVVPLLVLWAVRDRGGDGFYGLRFTGVDLRPYFAMLAIAFPLVLWASFQRDFQATYPILKPWQAALAFGLTERQVIAVFEPFYGMSFFTIELLFRGALVVGMARLLGKDAILPMVGMYAFLHFGKPLGEAVSSIVGGYILGVIALRTRHILGGVVAHVGVAYMMELTALFQHYRAS